MELTDHPQRHSVQKLACRNPCCTVAARLSEMRHLQAQVFTSVMHQAIAVLHACQHAVTLVSRYSIPSLSISVKAGDVHPGAVCQARRRCQDPGSAW